MALTAEQQAQVDIQLAVENARHANQMEAENINHANQMDVELKRIKLENIKLAKETLIENARSQPVDSREITAQAIIAFASILDTYTNT